LTAEVFIGSNKKSQNTHMVAMVGGGGENKYYIVESVIFK